MGRYVLGNILRFVLLMATVSAVVFLLVGLSPVDPVAANVGQAALANMSDEKLAELNSYWGKDTPILERYAAWAWALLHGDMGTSLRFNAPVSQVIATRALNSLLLMSIAWVASGALGFALGVAAGANKGSALDRAVRAYCFVLASSPTFWVALLLLIVFGVWLGWFPIGFSQPIGTTGGVSLAQALQHLALPAAALTLAGTANVALHTREKTVDVMQQPFMRFALARGESKAGAIWRHGLRNLALPALSIQFAQISEIFGGSVLVEQVFSYPGLGQAAVTAGIGGDAALLAGIALVSAAIVFGGNLAANILYGVIDPRMRVGREARGCV